MPSLLASVACSSPPLRRSPASIVLFWRYALLLDTLQLVHSLVLSASEKECCLFHYTARCSFLFFFWLSFSLLRAHALHGVGVSVNNSHCHVLICIARQISPSFTVCSTCKYALCGSEFRCHIIYIFFKFKNVMSHHWIVPAWLSCVWHSHCSVSNGRLRCLLQASFLVGTQPST